MAKANWATLLYRNVADNVEAIINEQIKANDSGKEKINKIVGIGIVKKEKKMKYF